MPPRTRSWLPGARAYWFLAHVLIGREKAIYTSLASAPGGWNGWRTFRIESKQQESEIITSFVLRPEDGKPVLRHQPGQYLTFWIEVPGQHPLKRNYSISSAPNDETYRISVKREPQGIASTWLHDKTEVGTILKVAPPAGEFFLNEESPRPVVLLSGGVGLTPMMSMLETIAARYPNKSVHYVHGTLNGSTHAMRDPVRSLAAAYPNIKATTTTNTA
jgi:nitric oxide dioxygenase